MPVCEIDLRVGGAWRFVGRGPKGESGFLRRVSRDRAARAVVFTEIFEPFPDAESVVTSVFTEENGKTRLTVTALYPSLEVRDMVLKTGMERGAAISYDRLEEVAAELALRRPPSTRHRPGNRHDTFLIVENGRLGDWRAVRAYLATLPADARRHLLKLREADSRGAPGASESFGYGMPAFSLDGKPFVWYTGLEASQQPLPVDQSDPARLRRRCNQYETSGKGTVRFPLDAPPPVGARQAAREGTHRRATSGQDEEIQGVVLK